MCFVTQSVHYSYNTLRSWGISSPVCLELILSASLDPKVWEIWRTNEQSPHRSIRTRVLELWICGIGLIYCGLSATCEEFKVLLCKVLCKGLRCAECEMSRMIRGDEFPTLWNCFSLDSLYQSLPCCSKKRKKENTPINYRIIT